MLYALMFAFVVSSGDVPPPKKLPADKEPTKEKKDAGPDREPVGVQVPTHLAKKVSNPNQECVLQITALFGLGILLFGAGAIALVSYLTAKGHLRETSCVRLAALIFLATLAALLIAAGFSQTEIGTAMTLLGTLAGYIFGRSAESGQSPSTNPPAPP